MTVDDEETVSDDDINDLEDWQDYFDGIEEDYYRHMKKRKKKYESRYKKGGPNRAQKKS